MNKIKQVLTSRTVWSLVALFLFNGISAINSEVPASMTPFVSALLGILTIYFKVFPSQNYSK